MAHRSNTAARPVPNLAAVPLSFEVGSHTIRVAKVMEGRWTVTVDNGPSPSSYATQADAWEAGVREADRLDRSPVTA
jgi:hypothetical protein